jgi:hypothetical protein
MVSRAFSSPAVHFRVSMDLTPSAKQYKPIYIGNEYIGVILL